MRLIDANALKKEIEKNVDIQDLYLLGHFFNFIDNTPTVELEQIKNELNNELNELKKTERPHGRWVCDDILHGKYHCSECRSDSINVQPFCAWCGADMRGKKKMKAILTDSEKFKKIKEIMEEWRNDTTTFSGDYMNKIDDILNANRPY